MMNNNPPTAVQSQYNPTPIEASGNGTDTPVPHSKLARILEYLNLDTRVGYAFHIMAGDKLSRRGIVLDDTPKTFIVSYCDVFGMPHEMKKVSKERTTSWKWFSDVEHSNVVYDKLFGVRA